MNKKEAPLKIRYFIALLVFLLTATAAFSQNPVTLPTPTGQVNDFAGAMDASIKQQVETRLREFKKKTNVDIAVAIVNTTGERPIFDYSLQMAREWGIGSKETDNPSALLLVAIGDRKYYTQVSKDLEDELPDGLVGQLQRQYLVPEFKQGNYSKGIADTIDAYVMTIEAKQTGVAPPSGGTTTPKNSSGRGIFPSSVCTLFFCLAPVVIILILVFKGMGRRRNGYRDRDRWGGGGYGRGGGSGDIASHVVAGVAGAIIGNMLGGGSSSSGSSSDWGGSSSSDSGGGGGGWGGFGGGGDFGGGGAGGDW